jgi:hypothetical protein
MGMPAVALWYISLSWLATVWIVMKMVKTALNSPRRLDHFVGQFGPTQRFRFGKNYPFPTEDLTHALWDINGVAVSCRRSGVGR